jgi:hypothetical protein
MSAGVSYLKGDVGGMMSGLMGIGKQLINSQSGAAQKAKQCVSGSWCRGCILIWWLVGPRRVRPMLFRGRGARMTKRYV